jgi:protein-tyrosine phosphatase
MIRPEIYWLSEISNARLAVMPRPRGEDWLSDEVFGWHREGLSLVVSLLEAHEVRELGLREEENLCRLAGIEFVSFPISDRGVPSSISNVIPLVEQVFCQLKRGAAVGIHCRAGIGRSALLAACVLGRLGIPEAEAFPLIARARGVPVPDTEVQVEWLSVFCREISHKS